MKRGTRQSLLKPRPIRTLDVVVPEDFPDADLAGVAFTVKTMTAREKALFEESLVNGKGESIPARRREIRERLLLATVIDPDTGARLFADEDLPALSQTDAGLIEMLVAAAMTLNKVEATDIEQLAKNSGAAPGGDSPSASPSPADARTSTRSSKS